MDLKIDPRISQSLSRTSPSTSPDKTKTQEKLRESSREFEAMYIFEMYKAMRKNIPDSGLIEKGLSTTMYQEMLDMEMAKETAKGEGMGLGEAMYQQLKEKM